MQIESNQSKPPLGWLPLCIYCEFETNILFLIFLFCEACATFTSPLSSPRCVFNVEFMLLCFLIFYFLFACVLLQTNSLQKGEVSFPVEWIDRFVRRKRWIISAVAKGCHEVV